MCVCVCLCSVLCNPHLNTQNGQLAGFFAWTVFTVCFIASYIWIQGIKDWEDNSCFILNTNGDSAYVIYGKHWNLTQTVDDVKKGDVMSYIFLLFFCLFSFFFHFFFSFFFPSFRAFQTLFAVCGCNITVYISRVSSCLSPATLRFRAIIILFLFVWSYLVIFFVLFFCYFFWFFFLWLLKKIW